jgi:hypothetical protein
MALGRLEREPWLEGDYDPGDGLVATLKLPVDYWSADADQLITMQVKIRISSERSRDALKQLRARPQT